MTNKERAVMRAAFYAHEKPDLLAELIAPLITDTATSVTLEGPTSVELDTENGSEVTYTGAVLSQFGDTMSGSITYSLKSSVEGVSIAENRVTIAKTVSDATEYTVVATSGGLSSEVTTTVTVSAAE